MRKGVYIVETSHHARRTMEIRARYRVEMYVIDARVIRFIEYIIVLL